MKSASRLYTVQALFQMEASDQTMDEVCAQFIDHRFGSTIDGNEFAEGNVDHFETLVFEAVNNQAKN
jgi:N utilization substance protein B